MRNRVLKTEEWPNEMDMRLMMIEACKKFGSKAEFCRKVGLSTRYVNLIMEWKRSPAHPKLLRHFGVEKVYTMPEDLREDQ